MVKGLSMKMRSNFWVPPASGYTPASRGLMEARLAAIELRNGFSFPVAYRSLMRQQNGGKLRYSSFRGLSVEEFCCLSEKDQGVVTFEDYIALTCAEEDVAALQACASSSDKSEFFNLKRLIVFAINGHEVGCFDYGWRCEAAVVDPKIVFFGSDGRDVLHFKILTIVENFRDFIDEIALPDELNEKKYLGIESSLDFDSLCACLEEGWRIRFDQREDDLYGRFDFERWYSGAVPLFLDDETLRIYAEETNASFQEVLDWVGSDGRTRSVAAIISPNQHRSGTYLYPDNPELVMVLEISKPWFPTERAIEQLCARLIALQNVDAVKILP